MIPKSLPTGGEQITVTATSGNLLDLIRTAASDNTFVFDEGTNAVILQPEDGDIRYSFSFTPTTNLGIQILSGSSASLNQISLDSIKLIRDGAGDVVVNLQVYQTNTLN